MTMHYPKVALIGLGLIGGSFSLAAKRAGLVGHVREEQEKPSMRTIWETSEEAIPYDGTIPGT